MQMAGCALGRLGMTDGVASSLRAALAGTGGLVLVAGPPGSGRHTTLNALADAAPGAKSAPPLRDRTTAQTAFAVAGQGLVVAIIDAPDTVAVIAMLRRWGLPGDLLATRLRAVVAQRLAPRLCPVCRVPVEADPSRAAQLGLDPGAFVYAPGTGRACAACSNLGWHGRIGLFEAFAVDPALAALIAMDGDAAVLAGQAFRDRPNLPAIARFMVRNGLVAAEDAVGFCRVAVRELA